MKRFLLLALGCALCLLASGPVQALTAIPRSFDELVARADTVFKGSVTAKESRWTGEGDRRHIVTFVTFRVDETYKGVAANEQTLRFLGGAVGDVAMDVADMPKFEVGQKAVLFVVNNGKQFCPLVGLAEGRFRVVKDAATGREHVLTNEETPVVSTADIGRVDAASTSHLRRAVHPASEAMAAEDFRTEILGKVATAPR